MGDGGAAPMKVEMGEDDARNPTGDFVIKGERRGTQCFEWTCRCCKGKFGGRLRKLAMHIAGEKFAGDNAMNVGACNPASFLKEGDKLVQNTEGPELLKRARPLVRKYIAHCNEQGRSKVARNQAAISVANLERSRG